MCTLSENHISKSKYIDPIIEKFDNINESFHDLANKRYENDEFEDGDKIEFINDLINDIKYGYISK